MEDVAAARHGCDCAGGQVGFAVPGSQSSSQSRLGPVQWWRWVRVNVVREISVRSAMVIACE